MSTPPAGMAGLQVAYGLTDGGKITMDVTMPGTDAAATFEFGPGPEAQFAIRLMAASFDDILIAAYRAAGGDDTFTLPRLNTELLATTTEGP